MLPRGHKKLKVTCPCLGAAYDAHSQLELKKRSLSWQQQHELAAPSLKHFIVIPEPAQSLTVSARELHIALARTTAAREQQLTRTSP